MSAKYEVVNGNLVRDGVICQCRKVPPVVVHLQTKVGPPQQQLQFQACGTVCSLFSVEEPIGSGRQFAVLRCASGTPPSYRIEAVREEISKGIRPLVS